MEMKYQYKDTFAVIGKADEGPADNATKWINALWDEAGDNFIEIENIVRKDDNGGAFWWGLMDDTGGIIKYMTGCEVNPSVATPARWSKWDIPARSYIVVRSTPDKTGEVFRKIKNNPNIRLIGVGYEHYPEPDNNSVVDVYVPIAEGQLICQSCSMPMTKPEDFGTEKDGVPICNYCHHCYENGVLLKDVTLDKLTADVQALIDIENKHPDLLSTPLLNKIKEWLSFESDSAKTAALLALLTELVDGQDCDFTGTRWEKEWLADGKVCHCIACVAARKCIADIKSMGR